MVSDGQSVGLPVSDQALQPPIAGVPQTGLLDPRGDHRCPDVAVHAEARRPFVRQYSVGLRAGPHPVIEMRRFQAQVESGSQLGQQMKERRGVRSPRQRHDDL